jgi:hypothetical protein
MISTGTAKKINILCLLAAVLIFLLFPLRKEIWYDETVSMLCSKGISHDAAAIFSNTATVSSSALEQLNTAGNVFTATVLDNSNSFLYNILLHWFTLLCGNSIGAYVLLSKLCGIATLIAFYVLCNLFFEQSAFTALAVLLLALDNNISGMSSEIRAYSLGTFFATLGGIYFYKFTFQKDRPWYLFLLALFSVFAVLSHFLSVYVVLAFLGIMLFYKRAALFSVRNMVVALLPLGVLVVFFVFASYGLRVMNRQNAVIQSSVHDFSAWEVVLRSMKFTAINFKVVFPAFSDKMLVIVLSFLLLISLYVAGIKVAADGPKRKLHILFILGVSGAVFLSLLCLRSHHYTALYFRYFSFANPFCCLFAAMLIFVLFNSPKINLVARLSLTALILLPVVGYFIMVQYKANPSVKYNHIAVAHEIVKDGVSRIEVPEWKDAFLIQSVLPAGYKIDYVRNATSPYFVIYKATGATKVLVIRKES